jgi:hypothetical protein
VNPKRRDALLGAFFSALVGAAVLYVNLAHPERQTQLSYTLKACFEDLSRCRSQPLIQLEGTFAPGTLLKSTRGCGAEFDLQSPGGDPPGKVRVCVEQGTPNLNPSCARQDLRVAVEGHFDGARFLAERVLTRTDNAAPCADSGSR